MGLEACSDEGYKKQMKEKEAALKVAEKKSPSRLLRFAVKKYQKDEKFKEAKSLMGDLYYAMCEMIESGQMDPHAAIKDFASGAMALFGMKHSEKENKEDDEDEDESEEY